MRIFPRQSIFYRIFSYTTIFVILVSTGFMILFITNHAKLMEEEEIRKYIKLSQVASISISTGYAIKNWPFEILREIKNDKAVKFWHIVRPDGKVELSSNPELWGKKIENLHRYTDKLIVIDSVYRKKNIKLIISPIQIREKGKLWTFWMGISLNIIKKLQNKFIIGSIILIFILMALISIFMSFALKKIQVPINKIIMGLNKVADGDLDYKLNISNKNEFGTIARFFNRMADDLKKLWEEMKEKNEEIQIKNEELKTSNEELQITNEELLEKEKELEKAHKKLEKYSLHLKSMVDEKVRELKKATEQLIQTEKIVALGELVSGIAHEINNPLTSILGYAQVLLSEMRNNNPFRSDIEIIEKEAQRTKKIIENLLNYARREDIVYEDVNINQVIIDTLSFIEYQLTTARVQIIKEFADNIPVIKGNKQQFQQVFVNMMVNAKNAMHTGGILTIKTRVKDNFVVVEISDTGIGIDESIINKIFNPFFTTKEAGKGTGLGLSLCARIIHNYNGKIEVESEKAIGTTFKIFFPINNSEVNPE